MALPYLQPKKMASMMIASTKPKGGVEEEKLEGEEDHGLMSAAEDLVSAVHSKDASAVASALRAAHSICSGSSDDEMNDKSNLEWPDDQD